MFDEKVVAEAQVLMDEGPGNVMDTDLHGVHWDHHTYILEVHPPGEAPVRVETKAKVPVRSAPRPGTWSRSGARGLLTGGARGVFPLKMKGLRSG